MLRRGLRRLSTSVLHHTTDVRLALDTGPITPLLRKCGALDASDDIAQVRQFSHGQSNPTYILESSAGARLVLRKQPPGKLLRGAHAVDREFTVIQALHNSTTIPVPRPHVFVDDASVVGTPFYVYSTATLLRHFRLFDEALEGMDHLVCYAMKAASNQAILKTLAEAGAGMDVVSIGEYLRAKARPPHHRAKPTCGASAWTGTATTRTHHSRRRGRRRSSVPRTATRPSS